MDGMDMGTSGGGVSMISMMIPWLHIGDSNDTLLFKSWQPKSSGAIAGACIGLVIVCLLERWLSGFRAVLEAHWRQRVLSASRAKDDKKQSSAKPISEKCCDDSTEESIVPVKISQNVPATRTIAPFIPAHDISRGFLYAIQALFGYILMLAVMTFQVAYILSIVLGLGLGEMLFGRMGSVGGHGVLH